MNDSLKKEDSIKYSFEDILEKDGILTYKTKGISMQPLFVAGRDIVVIEKKNNGRLSKYDVPLYRRNGKYVLHRVVKVRKSDYVIRGDNTYNDEYVKDSDVIGVLKSFQRKGKSGKVTDLNYRMYSAFWTLIYPLRKLKREAKRYLTNRFGKKK